MGQLIGISFILELVYNVTNHQGSLVLLVKDPENIVDSLLIFQILWIVSGGQRYKWISIFNILRAVRVTKLRYITKLVSHYLKSFVFEQNDDLAEEETQDFDEEGQLNTFIVDSLIKFTSSILIESTYFLVFDELVDHEGFVPHSREEKMDYLKAAYFVVVSFSTIGYGDIYPRQPLTRLASCLALIVNITVMSNFLGKMVEFLFQLSPYDTAYDFQDHVVIIGQIGDDQLKEFLDELVQLDLANRSLLRNSSRIKTLIISEDEPSEFMVDMAFFYTEEYENEVNFLKEGIFTQSQKWCAQSNLKKARILFAFSWANDDGESYENDQMVALVATGVKNNHPNLKIVLILNSNFKEQLEKDSLYHGIEAISPYEINDFIMASSIQNPGISTILQQLITMKAKTIPDPVSKIVQEETFLQSYVRCMQQEVYQFAIPDFYLGMDFKHCALMLYLYGLEIGEKEFVQNQFVQDHIKDDRKMTLIAVETSTSTITQEMDAQLPHDQNPDNNNGRTQYRLTQNQQEEEDNGFIHNAHTRKTDNHDNTYSKNLYRTQVLINPQDYQLKRGDIGYVICEDYETVLEALTINSKANDKYLNYQRNLSAMQFNLQTNETDKDILSMYVEMKARYRTIVDTTDWASKDKAFPEVFDLFEEDNEPLFKFEQHTIIFGNLNSLYNILSILRQYTQHPMVLFSNDQLDAFKWNDLKQTYKNIFYIKGDFLNLEHLSTLEIKKAENILILSDLMNITFPDAIGLCLARILLDHYDRNDFMIELKDERKTTFLNNNPKLKHVHCPYSLLPSFAAGNVHFTSMITAILAKVVYTTNWIHFFKDLTIPSTKNEYKTKCNKTLHYLKITDGIAKLRFFGQLQYALLQSEPSVIAIGLIKQTSVSHYRERTIDQFLTKQFQSKIENLIQDVDEQPDQFTKQDIFEFDFNQEIATFSPSKRRKNDQQQEKKQKKIRRQINGIITKKLGNRVILNNPSFYTIIEPNDGVLVLGEISVEEEIDIVKELKGTQDTKLNKQANKYIEKLKNINGFKNGTLRAMFKDDIIQSLQQKHKLFSKFQKEFEDHLQLYQ